MPHVNTQPFPDAIQESSRLRELKRDQRILVAQEHLIKFSVYVVEIEEPSARLSSRLTHRLPPMPRLPRPSARQGNAQRDDEQSEEQVESAHPADRDTQAASPT